MTENIGLLAIGLILGAVIILLIWKQKISVKKSTVKESAHSVMESMRKVFKVVLAEGFFNELYNYEETKKLFRLIPSTKRALVIIQAKVLVGFDFEKCVWEVDDVHQKVKLLSFPEPEIVSIETDYKYYNFDEGLFNLLSREDLTRIQVGGKKQVEMAAIKSDLPKMAAEQMRTLLAEVVHAKSWQLENIYKITAGNRNIIPPEKPKALS